MRLKLLLIFFLFTFSAKAEYGYMRLAALINSAENVAIGTIVKLDTNYFWLKIEKTIAGKEQGDTIPIMRFRNWACAKRYAPYAIGQKELVCFHKSNDLIEDFDYLGYGGGSEYEMPITGDSVAYTFAYGRSRSYVLSDLLTAIVDYRKLDQYSAKAIEEFTERSPIHKALIPPKRKDEYNYGDGTIKKYEGTISRIGIKYLYEGYDNKIIVSLKKKSLKNIFLEVDDAEVRRDGDHFIVNPKGGWSSRWVNAKRIKGHDTITVLNELFEVYPIPEPTIFIGSTSSDTIPKHQHIYPRLIYTIGGRENEELIYKVLKFEVSINGGKEVICKNEHGNHELSDIVSKLNIGDRIRVDNIIAQYPDGSVRSVKGKEVYVYEVE